MKLVAINTVVIPCPSGQHDLVGHRDDGSAITRERSLTVYPGNAFEADAITADRLIEFGAATTDLAWTDPRGGGDHDAA